MHGVFVIQGIEERHLELPITGKRKGQHNADRKKQVKRPVGKKQV